MTITWGDLPQQPWPEATEPPAEALADWLLSLSREHLLWVLDKKRADWSQDTQCFLMGHEDALSRVMDERNDALRRIDLTLAACEEEIDSGGPGTNALGSFPVRVRTILTVPMSMLRHVEIDFEPDDIPTMPRCRCVEVDGYGMDRTACRADQHREPASLTGGSTETADSDSDDPAHSQSSGSGVHAANKFPAKDGQEADSRPPVAPAPLPE